MEEEQRKLQYYVDFPANLPIPIFYSNEFNGENIPESAIPITDEQWQEYVAAAHLYRLDEDGKSIRLKTRKELDDEAAARQPAPKTPEQQQIEALEAENADLKSRLGDVELIMADLLIGRGE
ncbi:hypothetical protein [Paenibacillus sp. GCM10027626]|uniref:hypothetical protein n=1 Tax=Paenibacillus sp. GCM10027626 TaxID=3273411 RepID=UPI003630C6CA